MNKARRAAIRAALDKISAVIEEEKSNLESLRDEEQDYMDNMPESMQGGEKYETADAAVNALNDFIDKLEEVDFSEVESACEI